MREYYGWVGKGIAGYSGYLYATRERALEEKPDDTKVLYKFIVDYDKGKIISGEPV